MGCTAVGCPPPPAPWSHTSSAEVIHLGSRRMGLHASNCSACLCTSSSHAAIDHDANVLINGTRGSTAVPRPDASGMHSTADLMTGPLEIRHLLVPTVAGELRRCQPCPRLKVASGLLLKCKPFLGNGRSSWAAAVASMPGKYHMWLTKSMACADMMQPQPGKFSWHPPSK